MVIGLREEGRTWASIQVPYKASKYNELIGWHLVYKTSSAAEKKTLPPPVKPESGKAAPIKIETFFLNATNLDLLKKLIMSDLTAENSVILAEIQARLTAK